MDTQKLLTGTPSTEYKACQFSDSLETGSTKSEPVWSEGTAERARHCLFLVQFMQQMAFAGIIVDSYQVGRLLGVSPAFSGLLVGLFMTGGAVGTSAMTLVLHVMPEAWKELRGILLTCQSMDLTGALLYTMLIHWAVHGAPGAPGMAGISAIALVRFLWGLGSGVTGQLAGVAITKMTPPGELPERMQCLQFWQTLGLGMGPLIVGLAIFADGLPFAPSVGPAKLCAAPATLATFQILVLLTVFQHCPASIQAWQSSNSSGQVSGVTLNPEKQPARVQVLFLCSCFLLCALRGYAVAGAEVGTSLLLETPYGWNRHSIGFLVSGTFLASIPLRSTYLSIRDSFSVVAWIRILSLVAICGTTLVFSRVTHIVSGGVILVLADAVMFPALYLGEGLTRGLMMQFAKENAIFSVNLSSFLAIVLNNVARTIAPWLSRLNLSAGDDPSEGQNLFAACQLTCCILFLGVFEAGVRHVTPAARPVLVIGLPSLNEAENIEALTKVVDEGCQRYFPQHRCLLVNADCQSSDGTAAIFAQTQTRCEKVSLRTALPAEGKGAALKLVFSCMVEVNAAHGICLDTDLKTMTPEWIRAFSLALQYDFAVPRYLRHRCDGFITNMVVYPSICAVFGYDIRQAIGGDFGFSRRAAEAFLAQTWPAKVEKYHDGAQARIFDG